MVSIKHKFQSLKSDGPDDTLVQPSEWNDEHDIETSQSDVVVGRESSGAGAAQEIPCTSVGRAILALATNSAVFELIKQAATTAATGVVRLASKSEAEAGTEDTKVMTPLRTKQAIAALETADVPVGLVSPYAGTSAPSKWLLCAGQAVSRTTYSDLFGIVGTTYGSGDGSTTFDLPDLRGRVAAGKDNMNSDTAGRLTSGGAGVNGGSLGASGGEETHQLTESEMPEHKHIDGFGENSNTGRYGRATGIGSASDYDMTGSSVTNGQYTSTEGGDDAHNNVQPTLVLNYIIYAGA